MLEKIQSFADGKYDLERKDIENIYFEQRGDAGEQLEELQMTKKGALHSTGTSPPTLRCGSCWQLCLQHTTALRGTETRQ